jgi:hypothetical protein
MTQIVCTDIFLGDSKKKIFFREYVLVHLSFANNRKLVY